MDWALRRAGHRTWAWSARCGHSGYAGTRTAASGAAYRHTRDCEPARETVRTH